jgi:HEPN domain-containing protein
MQPEPGSPRDWLDDATSDLALATSTSDRPIQWAHRCFRAQQAAEKAVLTGHGIDPPRTHNLGALFDLLPAAVTPSPSADEVADLSRHAAVARYPGSLELITEVHFHEALGLAEAVVAWAEGVVGTDTSPP